jgi:hypothetical protein
MTSQQHTTRSGPLKVRDLANGMELITQMGTSPSGKDYFILEFPDVLDDAAAVDLEGRFAQALGVRGAVWLQLQAPAPKARLGGVIADNDIGFDEAMDLFEDGPPLWFAEMSPCGLTFAFGAEKFLRRFPGDADLQRDDTEGPDR